MISDPNTDSIGYMTVSNRRERKRRPDDQARQKIRGVIGDAGAHKEINSNTERATRFRTGLRTVLLEIRSKLPFGSQHSFINWLESVSKGGGGLIRRALAFDLTPYVIHSPRISVEDEIQWLTTRLTPYIEDLKLFRTYANQLDLAFWNNNKAECFQIIDDLDKSVGRSIWSIETRLALEQHFNGLEGQKAFLSKIKNGYKSGLPAYIAHFASIRNEDRSTIRLFRADALRRIEITKLKDEAKTYFAYKIADEFDGTEASISAILRTEQGQSIIDIYETAIDLFQRLIKTGNRARYLQSIANTIEAWQGVGDFRTKKLLFALRETTAIDLSARDCEAASALLNENLTAAIRHAHRALLSDPTDAWAAIELAFSYSLASRKPPTRTGPVDFVLKQLVSIFSRDEQFEASAGALEKFSRNFRGLPTAAALNDFGAALGASRANPQIHLASACLNTKSIGVEDILSAAPENRPLLRDVLGETCDSEVINFWSGASSTITSNEHAAALQRFLAAQIDADSEAALQQFLEKPARLITIASPIRGLLSNLLIDISLREGEMNSALRHIAQEAALAPSVRPILPVDQAIADRPWSDIGKLEDKLALAICLDVLWRRTDDDLRATHLRFAFEDVLQSFSVRRPSDLEIDQTGDLERLSYFLRYICIPSVMDLSGIFSSSKELVDERLALLRKLEKAPNGWQEDLRQEVRDITSKNLLQEGLQIVDSSRVHVDTQAISRWAEQRYSESFSRYQALVAAGIGVAEDFESLLRNALNSSDSNSEYFRVPESEADSLLLELIIDLKNEFLTNKEHGLHFYLGKRIRHGTVTGHLRGPLETASLVTQRFSETGKYKSNTFWLEKLDFASQESRDACDAAFVIFASSYDEIVENLKNNLLHVTSPERPLGLFDISVTALTYHIIRSSAQTNLTFRNFLQVCYAVFWASLDSPFAKARNSIGHVSKNAAVVLFDELQEAVRQQATQNGNYHDLGSAIRNTSVEVQRQFDTMAEWFRRSEVEQATTFFTLRDLLNIAVSSALKTHTAFSPEVSLEVHGDILAAASTLVTVSDVVFVVIDNVCRRSMSGSKPKIHIKCTFDREQETLQIDIKNPVGDSLNRELVEATLDNIRRRIARGDITSGAGVEGGSGLLKIAAITRQSTRAGLTFGFFGDNQFQTSITLSVIFKADSIVAASDASTE